ncbi:hypothetical protein KY361_03795 [Candidatus Woesearchaeota archaeon]|nr:hypothetical protein [Candidatus Woesearchaeota archaeon]
MNSKLGYNVFLVVVALLTVTTCTYAYEVKYEEDFKEGEELSIGLGVLDILEFNYYNKTYSLRALGIYSKSAAIRVEHRAFDINLGETKSVNLDDLADYDLDVTLLSAGSDAALFKLKLNEKPWLNQIDNNDQDQTDTSSDSTSTTDTTSTTNNSTTDTDTSSTGYIRRRNMTRTISSSQNNTTNSVDSSEEQKDYIIGDAPINITINITLTPKSAVGLLLIVVIVLVGMSAYKGSGRRKRRGRKGYDTILDRFVCKLERKVKEIWKITRIKLGELIAGKKFDRNKKQSSKKRKSR